MFTPPEINENNYSSERTDEEQTREVEATTTFVSDANVVRSEVSLPKAVSSLFYKSSTDDYMLSIKTFFERPVKIGSGNFAVGDTVSIFNSYALTSPHDFINGVPLRSNKLAGFLGFRATSVYKIVVNATRFQQGRYMVVFVPLGGAGAANGNSIAWVTAHTATLIQRTQLPHVEIDLNCDTEAQLKIPYISCANFTPTASILTDTNQSFAVGRFMIFPYSSLLAGSGSTTAGFTIWHHFEDVELIAPAIPQSKRLGTSSTKKRNAPTDEEKKQNKLGLISTPMQIATTTLNALTAIPGLSTYAKPAAWVTERLGKAASIFGWSRPSDSSTPCRMYKALLPFVTTIDAADTSIPLSLSAQNCVTAVAGFSGTDIDELDFKNFVSIFSYFKSFDFAVANNAGDTLTSFNLNPNHFWSQVSGTGGKLFNHYQPLAFLAQYFALWRGSIKFRIKFVKTEFHSGRIAIAYSPIEAGITTAVQSYSTSDYLHREIIDLRESGEVEFVVPFISSSPWKPTTGTDNNIGTVSIYVVDPLIAPSSVQNKIVCLIEVAGGDDMSFAVPVQNSGQIPVFGLTPQSANITNKPDMCMLDSEVIGSAQITDSIDNSAYCVGEHISSFRSMLKMFWSLNNTTTSNPANTVLSILPFAWDYYYENASPVNPNWTSDLYGTLSSIFALSRGGVRLKFVDIANTGTVGVSNLSTLLTSTTPLTNMFIRNNTSDYLSTLPNTAQSGLRNYSIQSNGIMQDVTIPQYHRFHSRTNVDHMCNTTYQYSMAVGRLATRIFFTYMVNSGTNPLSVPLRACADDGNFGCFVSIPPMTGVPGTSTT